MMVSRSSLAGCGVTAVMASVMLAWPLFGNPPYAYYAPMKWVVGFASCAGAWAVWNVSKAFLPLSVLLVASGGVELFGKMRREEWVPFNWASMILLCVTAIACLIAAMKAHV